MHSRSSLSRHGAVMALCAIGLFAEPALAQGQQGPPSTKGFSVGTQMTLASRQAVDGPLNGQPGGADGFYRRAGAGATAGEQRLATARRGGHQPRAGDAAHRSIGERVPR